jgi:hypothetical protein
MIGRSKMNERLHDIDPKLDNIRKYDPIQDVVRCKCIVKEKES